MRTIMFWVVRLLIKPALSDRVPVAAQRAWGGVTGLTLLGPKGATYSETQLGGVATMTIEPRQHDAGRCVLYLHGGAYVMGGYASHRKLAAAIGDAAAARAVLPDYRMAPEHPHPAALDDALAVYSALLEAGQDPAQLCIAGDSAGGGLALALALAVRDAGMPAPASLVLLSPWVDLGLGGDTVAANAGRDPMLSAGWLRWAAGAYCANTQTTDTACSPLFADLAGLPSTLIHAGSEEILLDDARRLHSKAREAGTSCELRQFDGLWHVFQLQYGTLKVANQAVAEIGDFIRAQTGRGA